VDKRLTNEDKIVYILDVQNARIDRIEESINNIASAIKDLGAVILMVDKKVEKLKND
jgi:hypothetical protein